MEERLNNFILNDLSIFYSMNMLLYVVQKGDLGTDKAM